MLPYIVAGLTVTLLATAAAWFWRQFFGNPEPAGAQSSLDGPPEPPEPPQPPAPPQAPEQPPPPPGSAGSPPDGPPRPPEPPQPPEPPEPPEETAGPEEATARAAPQPPEETAPATPLGVRWSWRRHRLSGLQFLRVTVANAGPHATTLTRVRLRMSAELADRAGPPPDLLEASDYAVELFGPAPEAAPLPRRLEPGGSTEAYFPCRDVADWLYGVAESDNLDRGVCHLTPECVDDTGVSHPARQRVGYERWLQHGHGPSLQQYADGRDPQSAGGDR